MCCYFATANVDGNGECTTASVQRRVYNGECTTASVQRRVYNDVFPSSSLCRCFGGDSSDDDGVDTVRQQQEIYQLRDRISQRHHHSPTRGTPTTLHHPRQDSRVSPGQHRGAIINTTAAFLTPRTVPWTDRFVKANVLKWA